MLFEKLLEDVDQDDIQRYLQRGPTEQLRSSIADSIEQNKNARGFLARERCLGDTFYRLL